MDAVKRTAYVFWEFVRSCDEWNNNVWSFSSEKWVPFIFVGDFFLTIFVPGRSRRCWRLDDLFFFYPSIFLYRFYPGFPWIFVDSLNCDPLLRDVRNGLSDDRSQHRYVSCWPSSGSATGPLQPVLKQWRVSFASDHGLWKRRWFFLWRSMGDFGIKYQWLEFDDPFESYRLSLFVSARRIQEVTSNFKSECL
jgi:hypothetical protein